MLYLVKGRGFAYLHQNLSYKIGFAHGFGNRRPFSCPWWVDRVVYLNLRVAYFGQQRTFKPHFHAQL
jgi:hypothetical protein